MQMSVGKMLMILGVVLLPVTTFYIGYTIVPLGIPTPIGLAGFVRFANGTIIPEETVVWAENLNTHEKVWRATQDGKFAIPISARTGDKIKVWTEFHGMQASRIITANMSLVTHWANLTLGHTESEPLPPYWLLVIPLGLIGSGYAIERKRR